VRLWTLLQGLCKQLQPFLWVQKVARGHITAHSEGFFKIFIFWPFLAPFLVKIDPKLTFSLNLGAFFSGRVQNGFETQNGFTRSTFRGMPSFVPKFAFLVVENGLRNLPIWDFFKKMGTLLNVGAFFSGRVQNGFETQNGFTRSGFRGIPSLVLKFAFLVVENGLRNPPIWDFFKKWVLY
jgi:hypothetical protein